MSVIVRYGYTVYGTTSAVRPSAELTLFHVGDDPDDGQERVVGGMPQRIRLPTASPLGQWRAASV
jgi:hypothetical protein